MSLQTIIAEVQTETDKLGNTHLQLVKNAVRRAIISCHASARFALDLVEYNFDDFAIDTATYQYVGALPPRFRERYQVIAIDAQGNRLTNFTFTDEENLVDHFQFKVPRTVLILGKTIKINYECDPQALHLQYFAFPQIDMTAMTTDSFIVESFDIPIIHKAAHSIFAATGNQEGKQWQEGLYNEAKLELMQNFATLD